MEAKLKMAKTKILLLDNDNVHRSLLAEGLQEYYDFEVAMAGDLGEVEEGLRKARPDLLVLDCVIGPNRSEVIDWAKKMRRNRKLATMPILFVTAYFRQMEEQVRGIERSAILAKPFAFDDVIAAIRGLLGSVAGQE